MKNDINNPKIWRFLALFSLAWMPALCSAQKAPNIVYIMADDLGWVDISSHLTNEGNGSRYHETPNIDRLAEWNAPQILIHEL